MRTRKQVLRGPGRSGGGGHRSHRRDAVWFLELLEELGIECRVPGTIAQTIVDSLQSDSARAEAQRQKRIAATQQRIAALHGRMDQMYEAKLDGKIDDEFWTRKTNEWPEQERRLESEMSSLKAQGPATVLPRSRHPCRKGKCYDCHRAYSQTI
jgi:hypothetical protein